MVRRGFIWQQQSLPTFLPAQSLVFMLTPAGRDEDGETIGKAWLLKAMMWAQYPVFVALQLALVWRVYEFCLRYAYWHHGLSCGLKYKLE